MSAFGWKLKGDGRTIPPGEVVAPGERLSWPRTIGLGAQHVVAMFGATFVFPIIMGLNPQYAVMMSGIATIMFMLIVNGKIPSYLGTSASFVGAVAAIRLQGQGGSSDVQGLLDPSGAVTDKGKAALTANPNLLADAQLHDATNITGAILIAGLILLAVGIIVHFAGGGVVSAVLPPAVTGAVVMLIGFNLAPVVASAYWPKDQWVAVLTMVFVIVIAVVAKGFWGRVAILLGLIFGSVLSWIWDLADGGSRIDFSSVSSADWFGFPTNIMQHGTGADAQYIVGALAGPHLPTFNAAAILLVIPGVVALIAENTGHVKAVAEMTGDNLDPYLGRGFIGDGWGTAVAGFIGASPTTTYAENIGVMAATKVYSTAAYYVAALVAILFGFSPKFGALVSSIPPGVLGGITVILYGMIGLLGAKIWVENKVNFGAPQNLVPLSAGLIIGIGNVSIKFSDNFEISGIALGTIVVIVMYHVCRWFAPHLRREDGATGSALSVGDVVTEKGTESPWRDEEASNS